jgi:hypothetical protein
VDASLKRLGTDYIDLLQVSALWAGRGVSGGGGGVHWTVERGMVNGGSMCLAHGSKGVGWFDVTTVPMTFKLARACASPVLDTLQGCDGCVLLLLRCCRFTGLTAMCLCLVLLRMM